MRNANVRARVHKDCHIRAMKMSMFEKSYAWFDLKESNVVHRQQLDGCYVKQAKNCLVHEKCNCLIRELGKLSAECVNFTHSSHL